MMRASLLITAVAAACGGTSAPSTIEGHAPPASHPATDAPKVTWIDNGFETPGLPAIARDGSRVVLPIHVDDGGRGAPNLAITVRDRHDADLETTQILAVDEVDSMFDEHGMKPALRTRIAAATQRLTDLHAQLDLLPLTALATPEGFDPDERTRATGAGLDVEWKASHLTIRAGARAVIDVATPASWLAAERPMCAGCAETCHNAAFLGGVVADAERKLAVLTISYTGTDTCWEPSSQQHVVAW